MVLTHFIEYKIKRARIDYLYILKKHSVCIIYLILARPSFHLSPMNLKCPPRCDPVHISVQSYVSHSAVVPYTVPRQRKIAQTICRLFTNFFLTSQCLKKNSDMLFEI